MGIQVTSGPIVVDADDVQFTHRGRTIAIKLRESMWLNVLGCVRQPDGSWKVETDLTGDLFSSDPPGGGDVVGGWVKDKGNGDMLTFIRNVILPRLNAWLATLFPPQTTTAPAPAPAPTGTPTQQLHQSLRGLKFVTAADGTVKAQI